MKCNKEDRIALKRPCFSFVKDFKGLSGSGSCVWTVWTGPSVHQLSRSAVNLLDHDMFKTPEEEEEEEQFEAELTSRCSVSLSLCVCLGFVSSHGAVCWLQGPNRPVLLSRAADSAVLFTCCAFTLLQGRRANREDVSKQSQRLKENQTSSHLSKWSETVEIFQCSDPQNDFKEKQFGFWDTNTLHEFDCIVNTDCDLTSGSDSLMSSQWTI